MLVNDNLKWKVPDSRCKVTDYEVGVKLTSIDQCETTDILITKYFTIYTELGLPEWKYFSTYEVTIAARSGNTIYGTGVAKTKEFHTGESGEVHLFNSCWYAPRSIGPINANQFCGHIDLFTLCSVHHLLVEPRSGSGIN